MTINTKIKGWKFLNDEPESEVHFDFDGKSSLEDLQDELSKLEDRLVEIPGLITKQQNLATRKNSDAAYLLGLGWLKRRKWEKENSRTVEDAAKQLKAEAQDITAEVESLKTEKDRLPARIETLKSQINTLVHAEGKGIEKGIDTDSAKQLGEIEVAKQQQALEHQQMMMQKQAQETKRAMENAKEDKGKGSNTTQWVIVGIVGLLLVVGAIIAFKKFRAKPKIAAT